MNRTLAELTFSETDSQLAGFAKALSHPVRVQIIKLLLVKASCFTGDLTDLIPLAQSTISQHLKVLVDAELIQGEIMPPKVRYCLNRKNWDLASSLFGELFSTETQISKQSKTCCT